MTKIVVLAAIAPFLDEFSDVQRFQQAALAEAAQLDYYFLGVSLRAYRCEDSHRSSVLRDDDPLAACYFLQELGELGLGLIGSYRRHSHPPLGRSTTSIENPR
jgi:hypothetical protein